MKHLIAILISFLLVFANAETKGQAWEWANGTRGSNCYGQFSSVGPLGDIYVCGEAFTGMNYLTDTLKNIGYARMYISKFDSSGKLKWIKGNTGRNSSGGILGIANDAVGNVYLLGGYDSVISFDANTLINPYLGKYTVPSGVYIYNVFLAKFDANGNNKWVKSMGDFPYCTSSANNGIKSDCNGNVYFVSSFFKDAKIGSYSFSNYDTSGSTPDILIAKLDSNGNTIWAKQFGGDSTDYAMSFGITSTEEMYVTGCFNHSSLIIGSDTLIDTSNVDIYSNATFITKLDNAGNPIWSKGYQGRWLYFTDLAVDGSAEFYVSGFYNHDLSVDTYKLPYTPSSNSYISKYDANGNVLWLKVMQGEYVQAEGITLDGCGDVWVLGHFNGGGVATTNDTFDSHIVSPPTKNLDPLFIAGWSSTGSYINASVIASGGRASYKISTATDQASKLYIVGNNTLDTLNIAGSTLYGTKGYTNMFLAKYDPKLICSPNNLLNCEKISLGNIDPGYEEISIFPNPAYSECIINYNGTYENGKCSIYDVTGRLLNVYSLSSVNTTIPLTEFVSGIYFFKVDVNSEKTIFRKVVVVK